MKKAAVIFIVFGLLGSAEASIVNQQHGQFNGSGFTLSCMPESELTQTVTLPAKTCYSEDVVLETRIAPELQGAMLMYFGGLFVLRSRKSGNLSTA